jgi:hypothetical protein
MVVVLCKTCPNIWCYLQFPPWKGCSAPPVSNAADDETVMPLLDGPVRIFEPDLRLVKYRLVWVVPLEMVPEAFSALAVEMS